MMFIPLAHRGRRGRRGAQRGAQVASAVLGAVAAILGAGMAGTRRSWDAGPAWMTGVVVGVGVGLVLLLLALRFNASKDAEEHPVESSSDDTSVEDRRPWLVVIFALVAALLALGLFLGLTPRAAASQDAPTQSAFVLTRGGDTLVVERVTRGRSSIHGDLTIKGQARMTFVGELAPGPSVPNLSFKAWGSGASIDTPPLQSGTQRLGADSAFITVTVNGTERTMTRAITSNPLPLMNNEFMMFELAIQRARAQGGTTATVPMFALSGGMQLDVALAFVGADSVVVKLMGQETRFSIDAAGRITGGVLPAQNILIARVDGPAVDKISIGRPDYSAPKDASYTAEEVTVKTPAGHVLTGTLTMPRMARGRVPAVVTITGSGQQDRDESIALVPGYRLFRQVADTLGRRGIAVLRLDDRAINGSGGDVQKATSADFADDIRAGVAFLRARRDDIDGARIGLVGHSEGGLIGPMVARTDPRIATVVLMAGPAYTGRRIIDFQLRNGIMGAEQIPAASKDSALKAAMAEFDAAAARQPWMQYFLAYDPLPTARTLKMPVLIMQGGTDQQVTPDQAPLLAQAVRAGGNTDVTMQVFKDRNHLFLHDPSGYPGGYVRLTSGTIDGVVMGTLADWLVARLKP